MLARCFKIFQKSEETKTYDLYRHILFAAEAKYHKPSQNGSKANLRDQLFKEVRMIVCYNGPLED